MSRNHGSQRNVGGKPRADQSDAHQATDSKGEQPVLDLRAASGLRQDPQPLDEMTVARYLSGACSKAEQSRLREIIEGSPSLTQCIALARQILMDMEPAA